MTQSGPGPRTRDPEVLAAALEVSRELELERCFAALARLLARLGGVGRVLCYRYSASGFDLERISHTLAEDDPLRPEALALLDAQLIDDEVPAEGRLFEPCTLFEPEGGWGDAGPAAVLALPLIAGEERVALALVLDPPHGEPAGRLHALAGECGAAVAGALKVRDLKDLMIRDDTADCFNRRYFDEHLTGEVARALRFGGRLALIFLDMDNLKDINTAHGHSAGSQVLYEASVRINRSIRTVDRLFRFGGDEFCILLPETGPDGAREVAERVRRELSARPFLEETTGGESLTASFGVAAFPDHGRNAEALLEAADEAMRWVKRSGRNAIAVAGSLPVEAEGP